MIFKEGINQEREFWMLDCRLREMLCSLEVFMARKYGVELVVTSLIRKGKNTSVHFWGRGADVRSITFEPDEISEIITYINSHYPYGDGKHQAIIHHEVDGGGMHFHLQVNPEAILIWRQ